MKLRLTLAEFLEAVHVNSPVRVQIPLGGCKYSLDKLLSDIKPEEYFVYSRVVDSIGINIGDNLEIWVELEADA